MDRGAWQTAVLGVTKSQTRLKQLSRHKNYKKINIFSFIQNKKYEKHKPKANKTDYLKERDRKKRMAIG